MYYTLFANSFNSKSSVPSEPRARHTVTALLPSPLLLLPFRLLLPLLLFWLIVQIRHAWIYAEHNITKHTKNPTEKKSFPYFFFLYDFLHKFFSGRWRSPHKLTIPVLVVVVVSNLLFDRISCTKYCAHTTSICGILLHDLIVIFRAHTAVIFGVLYVHMHEHIDLLVGMWCVCAEAYHFLSCLPVYILLCAMVYTGMKFIAPPFRYECYAYKHWLCCF